jgi:hypothetical protein
VEAGYELGVRFEVLDEEFGVVRGQQGRAQVAGE